MFSQLSDCQSYLQVVEAVAEELQNRGLVRLVVDPVLVSTSGDALATAGELTACVACRSSSGAALPAILPPAVVILLASADACLNASAALVQAWLTC